MKQMKKEDFTIDENMLKIHEDIINLILELKSIDTPEEAQKRFDLMPKMNDDQMDRLKEILTKEVNKLKEIEDKRQRDRKEIEEKYKNII